MAWTRERLESVARERLGGARLIVVANREPYIHTFDGESLRCTTPASGLTTALDPVMRACAEQCRRCAASCRWMSGTASLAA